MDSVLQEHYFIGGRKALGFKFKTFNVDFTTVSVCVFSYEIFDLVLPLNYGLQYWPFIRSFRDTYAKMHRSIIIDLEKILQIITYF